jgi:protoporphyrinogen oxidase
MSNPNYFDYCIVGAGPSGLTLARQLLSGNKSVLLIERDSRIGGLAKSYAYKGHIFDTGPKRFHTDDPIVLSFIREILGDDLSSIGRSTKVYFLNKYFNWPLEPKDLLRLPVGTSARCFFDLLAKKSAEEPESFHQYVRQKYGETLYSLFFAPYTQKFLRWDADDIHADWASTGINRTVIDKRIKAGTLLDLVRNISLPEKIKTEFIYPTTGGFGAFYDRLAGLCEQHPQYELRLNDQIVELKRLDNRFVATTAQQATYEFGDLVWSGNLNDALELVPELGVKLHYLNTVFFNIVCRDSGVNQKHKAQWIYVSKGDTLVSRITCMKEFAPSTCPEGYYNIICEVTDSQSNPVYFYDPQKYENDVIEELVQMRFITSKSCVESVFINPVVDTYPIYHRRFHQDFASAVKALKRFSKNIHLLGRSGAFWYNNSDHSIRMAIDMAKYFLGKSQTPLDYRGYFGGKANQEQLQAEA